MADATILSLIATNVITIAAGTAWIRFKFDKELEKHRAKLTRENEMEMSKYKEELRKGSEKELSTLNAKLERLNSEHSLRFSHNLKECAEAIKTIFRLAVELRDQVHRYTQHIADTDKIQKAAFARRMNEKFEEFHRYFQQNRILIPNRVAELAYNFCLKLGEYQSKYDIIVAFPKANVNEATWEKKSNEIQDILLGLPKMLKDLEEECQKELGFSVKEKS